MTRGQRGAYKTRFLARFKTGTSGMMRHGLAALALATLAARVMAEESDTVSRVPHRFLELCVPGDQRPDCVGRRRGHIPLSA